MRQNTKEKTRKAVSLLLVLILLVSCVMPDFMQASKVKAAGISAREQIAALEGITIREDGVVEREVEAELIDLDAEYIASETAEAYFTNDGLTIYKADVTAATVSAYEALKNAIQETEEEITEAATEEIVEEITEATTEETVEEITEATTEEIAEEITEDSTEEENPQMEEDVELEELTEDGDVVEETQTEETSEEETQVQKRRILKAPARSSEVKNSTDIKDYLTSVALEKKSGDEWVTLSDGDTITNKESVRANLTWKISGEDFAANRGKTYTYQLPAGFTLSGSTSGNVLSGTGEAIGTFTVGTDGLVSIIYNDDYNSENSTVDNEMRVFAYASLQDIEDGNEVTFEWTEGETHIVIETEGDFTAKKTAKKLTTVMADESEIEYTIVIDSENGTKDDITIEDSLSLKGLNNFDQVTYDATTFSLINQDGEKVNLNDKLVVDNTNRKFTISDIPALGKNGQYTLTYKVKVKQSHTIPTVNGSVNNSLKATSGGKTRTDEAIISYPRKLVKSSGSFNREEQRMYWTVSVYTKGQDVTGYTFTDTATAPLFKRTDGTNTYSVRLNALNSKDGVIRTYDLNTVSGFSVSADEKTFSFIFPEAPEGTVRWQIAYNTQAVAAEGESRIDISNEAKVITPEGDLSWSATGTGVGYPWTATPGKQSLEVGKKDENGIATAYWSFNVDFSANTKISSGSITVTDGIQQAQQGSTGTSYPDDHYALRKDIEEDLKENLEVTVYDEKGQEQIITMNDLKGYRIVVHYYNKDWTNIANIKTSEEQKDKTKVKYFTIYVQPGTNKQLHIKNINVKRYRTYFDTKNYNAGEIWTLQNRVSSNNVTGSATGRYYESQGNISKQIGVPTSTTAGKVPTRWQPGGADINYDYAKFNINGEERIIVFYRVLVEADETQDIVLTDKLPDGLKLVAQMPFEMVTGQEYHLPMWGSGAEFQLGPYNGKEIVMGENNGWALSKTKNQPDGDRYNGGLSLRMNADGSFTLSIKNRGKIGPNGNKLYQADPNTGMIGFGYACYVEDWDAFSKYAGQSESGQTLEKVNIKNDVIWEGQGTSSVEADIVRERTVLEKQGEQAQENGVTKAAANYQIRINEPRTDFLEESDVLTVKDTIQSSSLKYLLDRDSIKLYEMKEDGTRGNEVEIEKIQISDVTETAGVYSQSITLEIADATAYILEYQYQVTEVIGGGDRGTFENRVEIEGIAYDKHELVEKNLGAVVVANYASLTIHKLDAENQLLYLNGAEFNLEQYDKEKDQFEVIDSFTIKDGKAGKLYDYNATNNKLEKDTLYRIVETKAPQSYQKTDEHTYFIIKRNKGTGTKIEIETDEEALSNTLEGKTSVAGEDVSKITIARLAPHTSSALYITNQKIKVELPKTGGMGRKILYIAGFALVACFAAGYGMKRKNSRKK